MVTEETSLETFWEYIADGWQRGSLCSRMDKQEERGREKAVGEELERMEGAMDRKAREGV